mmetsp:Transcript_18078/g.60983  ORF Transcript_18078/g.60983 Transcript_18078/m.60983 type:complete len:423 (+) Transcript_18078:1333-2601(+)
MAWIRALLLHPRGQGTRFLPLDWQPDNGRGARRALVGGGEEPGLLPSRHRRIPAPYRGVPPSNALYGGTGHVMYAVVQGEFSGGSRRRRAAHLPGEKPSKAAPVDGPKLRNAALVGRPFAPNVEMRRVNSKWSVATRFLEGPQPSHHGSSDPRWTAHRGRPPDRLRGAFRGALCVEGPLGMCRGAVVFFGPIRPRWLFQTHSGLCIGQRRSMEPLASPVASSKGGRRQSRAQDRLLVRISVFEAACPPFGAFSSRISKKCSGAVEIARSKIWSRKSAWKASKARCAANCRRRAPGRTAASCTVASSCSSSTRAAWRTVASCESTFRQNSSSTPSGAASSLRAFSAGRTKSSANLSRAHSMQCSMRCGKLRKVHMGMPPPSAAAPPSRYVFVLCGTMGSTLPDVPIVPDSRSGSSNLTHCAST